MEDAPAEPATDVSGVIGNPDTPYVELNGPGAGVGARGADGANRLPSSPAVGSFLPGAVGLFDVERTTSAYEGEGKRPDDGAPELTGT